MVMLFRLLLLVGLLSAAPLQAQNVTATLQRSEIQFGESVMLILQADQQTNEAPDLEVLQKEFDVLGRSSGSQINIVNGQQQFTAQWQIELAPKRAGKILIQPIRIGQGLSQALVLHVLTANPDQQSRQEQDILVEQELDKTSVFIQAQAILTIRLAHRINILDGSLSEPEIANTLLKRLGEDISYERQQSGSRYRVLERKYALFPQQSGSLTIPAIRFQGRIAEAGRNQFGFGGLLSRSRRIQRLANELTLQVKPAPDSVPQDTWLPAQSLRLQEVWKTEAGPSYKLGEPVMRVVHIKTDAVLANMLPDLIMPDSPDLRIYPDKALDHTSLEQDGVRSTRQQSIAYIPQASGRILLPAIKLPWWDTTTDQLRWAELPSRWIEVSEPAASQDKSDGQSLTEKPATSSPAKENNEAGAKQDISLPWKITTLVFLLLWLLTMLLWYRRGQGNKNDAADAFAEGNNKLPFKPNELKKACLENNAALARHCLLRWAGQKYDSSPIQSLGQLANQLHDAEFKQQILELQRQLYARHSGSWHGESLWQRFYSFQKSPAKTTNPQKEILPALYD